MEISKDKLLEGQKLAKKHGYKQLFVNAKGEFFTEKSFAFMSVGNNADDIAEVPLVGEVESEGKSEGKATNDLAKAADVIAAIDAAETVEAVEDIKKAELEGKNRKSVIEAVEKKLETFKKAE